MQAEELERIRRAYHIEHKSIRAIAREMKHSRFYAHVQAFNHFGGVPWRISYDNLATAVKLAVEGKGRREQRGFVSLRSHYLFESHFCTPAQGHEKGSHF